MGDGANMVRAGVVLTSGVSEAAAAAERGRRGKRFCVVADSERYHSRMSIKYSTISLRYDPVHLLGKREGWRVFSRLKMLPSMSSDRRWRARRERVVAAVSLRKIVLLLTAFCSSLRGCLLSDCTQRGKCKIPIVDWE